MDIPGGMPKPNSMDEFFALAPQYFNSQAARGKDVTVQFNVSGGDGGDWVVAIKDGTCTVEKGLAAKADGTVNASAQTLLGLARGEVDPLTAFMMGKVKVRGDMSVLLSLQSVFGL